MINREGMKLFDEWNQKYFDENDRLGGHSEDGDFVEGWCIIDNDRFVKTPNDLVGLLLFGYDENVFGVIEEWKRDSKADGSCMVCDGINLTFDELEKELEKYFD